MRNCKDCVFCQTDLITDYIKEIDLYKCDLDNDVIFDPRHEGENCTWFKERKHERRTLLTKIQDWLHIRNN